MNVSAVKVSGNDENWWSTRYVTTSLMATEMYCPLEEPIKEVISSEPMLFDSVKTEYIDNVVLITLILPDSIEVEVTTY